MNSYQQLMNQLEEIMERLQAGDLSLDDAIESYEQGMSVIKKLDKQLELAENKITKIKDNIR